MTRSRPEDTLHFMCVEYLAHALPEDAMFWSTAQTWKAPVQFGVKMKRLGVKAGFPDLCILNNGLLCCIELKSTKGRLSQAQKEMHVRLESAGARVFVCRSLEEVTKALSEFMVLRARVAA